MSTYSASARLEGRFWVVTVPGVGVTQARNLQEVDEMAVDLVAAMTGQDQADITVTVQVELGDELGQRLEEARALARDAELRQTQAAARTREVVLALRRTKGMTGRDVAQIVGVSEQRISQIVAAATRSAQLLATPVSEPTTPTSSAP